MIYLQDRDLLIRDMEEADTRVFFEEETAQGWHPDPGVFRMRLRDQADRTCTAMTALWQGYPAGYVYVYRTAKAGPFADQNIPIIVDFAVLMRFRRKGIGGRLMDAAETAAARLSDTVCLGVGLCGSYGSAQRMYVKRGYVPDGSGVWYHDQPCIQYETVCTVDDDLVLYLSKNLRA